MSDAWLAAAPGRTRDRVQQPMRVRGRDSKPGPGRAYRFITATVQPTAKIGIGA